MHMMVNISYTVNHCRSTVERHGAYDVIKIRSYVQINALVGVKSITEGSNLTLQVRQAHKIHQQYLRSYVAGIIV